MTTTDDPLLELLLPHIPAAEVPSSETTTAYLSRLTSLPLSSLLTTESTSLNTTSHTLDLSLQSLASRNHKAIITSSLHLSSLSSSVSALSSSLQDLKSALPDLDASLTSFAAKYRGGVENPHLASRAQNQLLNANLERLLDILQLPSLLQSLIAAQNYPSALDALAHVRRLRALYPNSPTVASVHASCEALQRTLTANLISTLRGPLKLPVAMKTVGFLRRTLGGSDERDVRALFLVCRHAYLCSLLSALQPLQDLAEEEAASNRGGVQTERFLKRWLEVFREQSFGIVSMYRSIFPGSLAKPASGSATPTPAAATAQRTGHSRSSSSLSTVLAENEDPDGGSMPDPVAAYEARLVEMLVEVLRRFLGGIREKSVRESLLTQVLYASGSLGRLGGEFAGVLAGVPEEVQGREDGEKKAEEEWEKEEKRREEEYVAVVARQKVLAGRLEAMSAGRNSGM
ncbi:oligomeric Golgi complex subunit 8 [Sphaerosporella brunnea]|uniref:Conserved oligomeric Golgi complex subunit 8 n=1 Tax=Sphaerosporella brunnea TaxID=1250544 RepID=A0A5J5EK02_9PEZI|nr:oligomeric Golgi complex subunit 8 [Sphaerosporella brunnea]